MMYNNLIHSSIDPVDEERRVLFTRNADLASNHTSNKCFKRQGTSSKKSDHMAIREWNMSHATVQVKNIGVR